MLIEYFYAQYTNYSKIKKIIISIQLKQKSFEAYINSKLTLLFIKLKENKDEKKT